MIPSAVFSVGPQKQYGFGLVLSGGGARGLAQIGVIKALDEAGIYPDIIVATSMGAIVGGLYAAGYSPDSILHLAKKMDWDAFFTNSAHRKHLFVSQKSEPITYLYELRFNYNFSLILPNSLSHGQSFYDFLAPLLAAAQYKANMDYDNFRIPLRIVSTDIVSGEKVVFSQGNIVTSIRASCSVPLAFSPVVQGDKILIDGGLSANIPVEAALEQGAQYIVAIDVTSPLWNRDQLDNPVHLVDQLVAIGVKKQKSFNKFQSNLVITPELSGFNNTNFVPIDSLFRIGYEATVPHLDEIKSALQDTMAAIFPNVVPIAQPKNNALKSDSIILIQGIKVQGNHRTTRGVIIKASGIHIGDTLTPKLLKESITSLHSTGLFDNVNMDIDSAQKIRIIVQEKKYWRSRFGLRFDEYHLGEGFVQPAYENLFGLGICASLHLQYGLRREKYTLGFQGNHLFTSNVANNLQIQLYTSKERIYRREILEREETVDSLIIQEQVLRKSGVIGMVGTQLGRATMLTGGVRLERYKVQLSDRSAFGDVLGLGFPKGLPYIMLRLIIDTMDKSPFPTRGQKHYLTVGAASKSVGGTENFIKMNGSFCNYFTFLRQHTFLSQFQCAWANHHLPEVERVYLGGAIQEERYRDLGVYNYIPFWGLRPRSMPGDVMVLLRTQYQHLIRKNIYTTIGLDWGYTWDKRLFDIHDSWPEFLHDSPIGIGFEVAYESLIGPIRISYGQLLKGTPRLGLLSNALIYFSIGHDF